MSRFEPRSRTLCHPDALLWLKLCFTWYGSKPYLREIRNKRDFQSAFGCWAHPKTDWPLRGYPINMYFIQRLHSCACIHMVENDEKHSKINVKSTFIIMRTRGSCKAREEKRFHCSLSPSFLVGTMWPLLLCMQF